MHVYFPGAHTPTYLLNLSGGFYLINIQLLAAVVIIIWGLVTTLALLWVSKEKFQDYLRPNERIETIKGGST